jgi:hypothetical protein
MTSEIKNEEKCHAGAYDRQYRYEGYEGYERRQATPGSLSEAGERR